MKFDVNAQPAFEHDCEDCIFLGHFEDEGRHFDLYYCPGEPTIVARYGSEGPRYASGIASAHSALMHRYRGEPSAPYLEALAHGYAEAFRRAYFTVRHRAQEIARNPQTGRIL